MNGTFILIKRNIKLFFKDKGMFTASLLTPLILLVLYATFLGKVYRESFTSNLPDFINLPDTIIDGLVGGQLISSILSVSCVTVSFCSNFLMVQDKANGTIKDLMVSPLKPSKLSLSYYIGTMVSTLIISLVAMVICLIYLNGVGFYMTRTDILLLTFDIFLLVLFGTGISSIINFFLSTQGQISAVTTIISAGYGFISGAYMPISSYGDGLRKVISFLPGTYGTGLVRNHTLNGVLLEMNNYGIPMDVIDKIRDSIDCNLYFYGNRVSVGGMYMILIISIIILLLIYVLLNRLKKYGS